jgi:photosystem II stability/assembly factor-like uncharacterized protein
VIHTPVAEISEFLASRRAADGGYLVAGDTGNTFRTEPDGSVVHIRSELTVTKFSATSAVE